MPNPYGSRTQRGGAAPDYWPAKVLVVGTRFKGNVKPGDRVLVNRFLSDSSRDGTFGGKDEADRRVFVAETDVAGVLEQSEAAE